MIEPDTINFILNCIAIYGLAWAIARQIRLTVQKYFECDSGRRISEAHAKVMIELAGRNPGEVVRAVRQDGTYKFEVGEEDDS